MKELSASGARLIHEIKTPLDAPVVDRLDVGEAQLYGGQASFDHPDPQLDAPQAFCVIRKRRTELLQHRFSASVTNSSSASCSVHDIAGTALSCQSVLLVLRIRREEELLVYERLGDVRSRLICQAKIALTLAARGQPEDGDEIARLLAEARAAAERLRIPEAEQIRAFQRELSLEGV